MRRSTVCLTVMAGVIAATFVGATRAEDWPHWRGPNHDGVSASKGFQPAWSEKPPVLWDVPIGSAFSGISIVDGKAYTCGTRNEQQVLFRIDVETGNIDWQTPFERQYPDGQGGDGTRATPTVHEGRVYILGGWGKLACFDANDGKEIWSRTLCAKPRWGYSGSVLIENDLAIVSAGGEDGPLLAMDKSSGVTRWKCGDDPIGYATPYPFTLKGKRYIAAFLGKSIIIAWSETGHVVWSAPWETSYDINAASPIFDRTYLFYSSGYRHGARLVKLLPAKDKLEIREVWENSSIRAKFQSPVLYEGHLYTSDEVGLKCVQFPTGEEKWEKRGIKHGTVVVADGYLIVLTEFGKLMIARATPAGFEPKTELQVLEGRCWTVPTLCDNRLYLRNLERVICLDLRKGDAKTTHAQ